MAFHGANMFALLDDEEGPKPTAVAPKPTAHSVPGDSKKPVAKLPEKPGELRERWCRNAVAVAPRTAGSGQRRQNSDGRWGGTDGTVASEMQCGRAADAALFFRRASSPRSHRKKCKSVWFYGERVLRRRVLTPHACPRASPPYPQLPLAAAAAPAAVAAPADADPVPPVSSRARSSAARAAAGSTSAAAGATRAAPGPAAKERRPLAAPTAPTAPAARACPETLKSQPPKTLITYFMCHSSLTVELAPREVASDNARRDARIRWSRFESLGFIPSPSRMLTVIQSHLSLAPPHPFLAPTATRPLAATAPAKATGASPGRRESESPLARAHPSL